MRIAAMVLGIVGGLLLFLLVHGILQWELAHGGIDTLGWVFFGFFMGLAGMAIAGGILALVRPVIGGIFMLVSGIGGFMISLQLLFLILVPIIVGPPLIIGGILSLAAHKKLPAVRVVAMILGIVGGSLLVLLLSEILHWGRTHEIGTLGWVIVGFLMGLVGMAIVGGALALVRPVIGGIFMLVSGIGGFMISLLFLFHFLVPFIVGPPLIIGGVLSLATAIRNNLNVRK